MKPKNNLILLYQKLFLGFMLLFTSVLFISCSEDIKQEIIFEAGVVDTIHFNYSNQAHIAVPIKIDSTVYDFLFDTGASTTLFDDEIAMESTSNHTSIFMDYYGEKRTERLIWPEKIELGKVSFLNFKNFQQTGLSIDGILGNNILRELCWVIDFKNDRIYVTNNIKNLKLQLGKGLPFTLRNNIVYVNAQIGSDTVPLIIDTGDPTAAIRMNNRNMGEDRKVDMIKWKYYRDPLNIYNESKPVVEDSSYETILPLKLGDRIYGDELVKYVNYREHAGVGLGFLSRFEKVIFDYPNHKLYFLGEGHKTVAYHIEANEAINGSGVWVGLQNSLVVVKGLSNQAQNEGLKLGDTVIGVDEVVFPKSLRDDFFQEQKELMNYINKTDIDSTVQSFEEIKNSKFMQLTTKLRNLDTVAVLHVKRKKEFVNLAVKPKVNFDKFPDTFQTYTQFNLDYLPILYTKGHMYKKPHIYFKKE
ncbi:retropepsin-like aspartic protease [Leeuwenhoekiella sp. NPDC079379]|uniref:retropepsin-like aspartic protease n=1 Tax=Leeuwenhoekiella sp. NPDC079379 TaxID=3364122 RepID=UPI0037CA6F37